MSPSPGNVLLTKNVADVAIKNSEIGPKNLTVHFRKKDTSVTRQQSGSFRTSLVLEGSSYSHPRHTKWSSLRIPKEAEKGSTSDFETAFKRPNGQVESVGKEVQSPTPITKEVIYVDFYY